MPILKANLSSRIYSASVERRSRHFQTFATIPSMFLWWRVALHCLLVLAPCSIEAQSFDWAATTSILVFGDSYSYVQGTEGRANYTFIGDAFNYGYTPTQLLLDEIVQNQTGTSAGGPNWVEYLTGCYAGRPANCTEYSRGQKQLWDFAFGGADISAKYLPLHHNYTVDLDRQIEQWSQYARPHLPIDPSRSLAVCWIG